MRSSSTYLTMADIAASFGVKPSYITSLDSATVALQSLGNYLNGKEFSQGGFSPSLKMTTAEIVSHLPTITISVLVYDGRLDECSINKNSG